MKLYLLLISLLLCGCSSLPTAIKDAPDLAVSYAQAKQNINSYKNTPVRWGGVIIEVENEQSYSLLQVVYYPLNYTGRPQLSKAPEGRFVVKSTDFLDPAIYTKNKEITLAGVLNGDIERIIGKKISACHSF
ncbi:MAG: Slp family lipoprotein [Methylococcales bacterium]